MAQYTGRGAFFKNYLAQKYDVGVEEIHTYEQAGGMTGPEFEFDEES